MGVQPSRDRSPSGDPVDDEPLIDRGRSLPLRLLALLGAVSVLMLGLSSVVIPLLQLQQPPPAPEPRDRALSS